MPLKLANFLTITQNKGYFAIQGHPRSLIFVPIESSYDFLLMIAGDVQVPWQSLDTHGPARVGFVPPTTSLSRR